MSSQRVALQEVLRWSNDRPAWQRDALRRLYESGSLSKHDEEELYSIARSARDLGDRDDGLLAPRPLRPGHLPAPSTAGENIRLRALCDVGQVNALAPGQRLAFAESGMTVVYGHNGSGKSGYARILGKVCRTRGRNRPVLPNVFERQRPGKPSATIVYLEGEDEREAVWREGESGPEGLTQMSFFDSECAQAQVGAENELAYAPAAVHVLRQLAETSKRLKDRANAELTSVKKGRASILADPPLRRGSTVSRVLSSLEADTPIQPIRELCSLSAALAGFLAELATSGDRSALIFDDPVSSLDHAWREVVAGRLAAEACERQVVVFTHDLVFLLFLQEKADEKNVKLKHWRLVRRTPHTGVLVEEPPGRTLKKRLGDLKNRIQRAAAIKRREGDAAYEPAARDIYRVLREAWESGVEEVLLGGVVKRFGRAVETKRLRKISDVSEEDIRTVECHMTKCSRYVHDQAAAIDQPVPDPDEIQKDITVLEEWSAAITRRRK